MAIKNKQKTTSNYAKTKTTTVPVKVVKTAQQIALEEMVAAQVTDRRFAPVTHEELTKSVTYVTAKNGLFKVTKTAVALFKEKLQDFDNPVVGLPEMEVGVELAIPKIPMKHLIKALSYYRDINTQDGTEASTLFFWNTDNSPLPNLPGLSSEGKLVTYCPTQVNSSTLSDFTKDENVNWLRQNMALLLELHSHNSMNSFFSATDDANENMTQFYGVWGKVANAEPEFSFRYVVGDSKVEVDPDLLIDWPTMDYKSEMVKVETVSIRDPEGLLDIEENTISKESAPEISHIKNELVRGPFKMVDYPADWMTQHEKKTYVYNYQKDANYGGYYGKKYGAGANQGSLWGSEKNAIETDSYGYGDAYSGYDDDYAYPYDHLAKPGVLGGGDELLEDLYEEAVRVYGSVGADITPGLKETFVDIVKELLTNKEDLSNFEQ